MKYILLLLLLPTILFGQSIVTVTPAISTTEIDSIIVAAGSTTVRSVTKPFSGITAGMKAAGLRFPLGTTVVSNTNDSILVLSQAATSTVALDSMRFEKFTSLQYSAGDALGFAFEMPKLRKINNIIVVDDVKQITAIKLVFFKAKFTETEDNLPFAVSDADADNIIGFISLATSEVFTNNQIVTQAVTALPVDLGGYEHVYCQLVDVGTPTFTAVKQIHLNIIGE